MAKQEKADNRSCRPVGDNQITLTARLSRGTAAIRVNPAFYLIRFSQIPSHEHPVPCFTIPAL